jgi:hypothetical protein
MKGRNAAGQQVAAHQVAALFDRRAPVGGEILAVAEKAGQQEVELAPQFTEVVFQRRAGQAQAMPGSILRTASAPAAGAFLTVCASSRMSRVVAVLHQFVGVAPQQRIGGETTSCSGISSKRHLAPGPRSESTLSGRKAFGLVLPVEDQRGRQDDQRGFVEAAGFFFQQQMGQRLGRFAEAHVVGQDAGQVLRAQELQPGQAFFLVGAQFQAEAGRRFDGGDALRRPQRSASAKTSLWPLELPAAGVGKFGQARCVEARQSQRIAAGESVKQVDQALPPAA